MKKLKFIENKSEITAGTRGSSLGIDAMRVAANKFSNPFFNHIDLVTLPDENHLLMEPVRHENAIRIEGLTKVYDYVGDAVKQSLESGEFPFVLAGDHGSAGGTIAGIKAAYPEKRLGVIWIDAHGDLHSPYTSPTGNMHGMPLGTALGVDNLASKVKDISAEEERLWNDLKNKYGISPKILAEDLVQIAVRDTETPEDELSDRKDIRNYPVKELREKGLDQVVEEIKEKLSNCDIIYVSFDVDSMDSEISNGTGTPVPNGLSVEEATLFMKAFASWENLVCMEMVEINPCLDEKGNVMAETAFGILEETTKVLNSKE